MKHEPTRHEPNAPSSMTRPTWLAILLVLVLLPASAHAACVRDNPDVLENYDGTIGEGRPLRDTVRHLPCSDGGSSTTPALRHGILLSPQTFALA